MTTKIKVLRREAYEEEVSRMSVVVRWAYDHGLPVVLWPLDNVITTLPVGKKPHMITSGIILQRGAQ